MLNIASLCKRISFRQFSISGKDLRRPVGRKANPERCRVCGKEGTPGVAAPRARVSLRLHSDPGWGGAPRQSPSIRFLALFTRSALASQLPYIMLLSHSISLSCGRACNVGMCLLGH